MSIQENPLTNRKYQWLPYLFYYYYYYFAFGNPLQVVATIAFDCKPVPGDRLPSYSKFKII